MGGSIVRSNGLKVVEVELIEVNKQFRQIAVQILIDLLERLTEFEGDFCS